MMTMYKNKGHEVFFCKGMDTLQWIFNEYECGDEINCNCDTVKVVLTWYHSVIWWENEIQ